jgi:hypothetical protein
MEGIVAYLRHCPKIHAWSNRGNYEPQSGELTGRSSRPCTLEYGITVDVQIRTKYVTAHSMFYGSTVGLQNSTQWTFRPLVLGSAVTNQISNFDLKKLQTYLISNEATYINITIIWSHSRHGCLSTFLLCLCCPVQVAALRRSDHPSKESYQLSVRMIISELILIGNRPEGLISKWK